MPQIVPDPTPASERPTTGDIAADLGTEPAAAPSASGPPTDAQPEASGAAVLGGDAEAFRPKVVESGAAEGQLEGDVALRNLRDELQDLV